MVHIRYPHVERHGTELEGQAHHQETQPEHQDQAVAARRGDCVRDRRQIEAAGCTIDHRHAIQQHAGGQRTEHEILHGGFRGNGGIAVDGNHGIQ
jgi:hypothetical protein